VKLDPKISAFVKSFSCASIDNLKTYPQLKRQATLNIMKDDHHEFEYIIQKAMEPYMHIVRLCLTVQIFNLYFR